MAGLETIALAVAHLERLQKEEGADESVGVPVPAVPSSDERGLSDDSSARPSQGTQARMVSDGTYQVSQHCLPGTGISGMMHSSKYPPEHEHTSIHWGMGMGNTGMGNTGMGNTGMGNTGMGNTGMGMGGHGHVSRSSLQISPSETETPHSTQRKLNEEQVQLQGQAEASDLHEQGQGSGVGTGPVAVLLNSIAMVSDNLDVFFVLMEKLEQLALPGGSKPADVPKPDENIGPVQRNDVLLGRGGETNHHIGNIQYRQLVKACQPAYLAAKRRDKPRIAAAIVGVVRARSGRFLKKHSADNSWKDVGNTRAREKTSQALREGAPELRGTVEASRTQLLQEAVESSRAQRLHDALEGPRDILSDQQRAHAHAHTAAVQAQRRASEERATMQHRATGQASPPVARGTIAMAQLVPGAAHHHSHYDLGLQSAPMYYHHHQGVPPMGAVVYHHPPPMDARYHHAYTNSKRQMTMPVAATQPPKKRQAVARPASFKSPGAGGAPAQGAAAVAPSARLRNNVLPASDDSGQKEDTVSATVSAEHSEEEPTAQLRAASPASSASSSKNSTAGRGPRIKLLKKRLEEKTTQV